MKGSLTALSVAAGLVYNINEISIKELRACGVARISLPTVAVLSALASIRHALTVVRNTEEFAELFQEGRVAGMEDLGEILAR